MMQRLDKLLWIPAALIAVLALSACNGRSGGGGGTTQTSETYSATVTSVEIVRSADSLDMPVAGLPAPGAELTIR